MCQGFQIDILLEARNLLRDIVTKTQVHTKSVTSHRATGVRPPPPVGALKREPVTQFSHLLKPAKDK